MSKSDNRKWFQYNNQVYANFAPDHPARRYLIQFYEIQREVCGRDVDWPGRPKIEQEWKSQLFQRSFRFSSYAYCFISFNLTMREWCEEGFYRSPSDWEKECVALYAMKKTLLDECTTAAADDGNGAILEFVEKVRSLLDLGIEVTAHRIGSDKVSLLKEWGQDPETAARGWLAANLPRKTLPQ